MAYIGSKMKLTPEGRAKGLMAVTMYENGRSVEEIAEALGISTAHLQLLVALYTREEESV